MMFYLSTLLRSLFANIDSRDASPPARRSFHLLELERYQRLSIAGERERRDEAE